MKQYYIKIYRGNVIGSPQLLESTDPQIQNVSMVLCPNYSDFNPLTNVIVSRQLVNNQVVYVFADYVPTTQEINLEKQKKKKEIDDGILNQPSCGFMSSLGIKFACKNSDINNLKNDIALLDSTQATTLTVLDYDNVAHQLTSNQINEILVGILNCRQTCVEKQVMLYSMVDSCTTIAQIRAINWQMSMPTN